MSGSPVVDVHCHLFSDLSPIGIDVSEVPDAVAPDVFLDAGTYGPENFPEFAGRAARMNAEATCPRVLGLVNVARRGLEVRPEISDASEFCPERAAAVAARFPEVAKSLKLRVVQPALGLLGLDLVAHSRDAARSAGLPLVVHLGQQEQADGAERMHTVEVLELLGRGDVVTHVFTSLPGGPLTSPEASQALARARARGVLVDVGHGKFNFDVRIARRAIAAGIHPDFISSDITRQTQSWLTLPFAMEAMLAVGSSADQVRAAVTDSAAFWLGLRDTPNGRTTRLAKDATSRIRTDSRGSSYACVHTVTFCREQENISRDRK